MKKIWFDMDGTIADLYGVKDWLPKLQAHDPTPYAKAKPLVNMAALSRMMRNRQAKGYKVCIVSALSKNSTPAYDAAVMKAKIAWLKKHLASVQFDEIRFVPYSFQKEDVNSGGDILFDDEQRHLEAWTGTAYHAKEMMEKLKRVVV